MFLNRYRQRLLFPIYTATSLLLTAVNLRQFAAWFPEDRWLGLVVLSLASVFLLHKELVGKTTPLPLCFHPKVSLLR